MARIVRALLYRDNDLVGKYSEIEINLFFVCDREWPLLLLLTVVRFYSLWTSRYTVQYLYSSQYISVYYSVYTVYYCHLLPLCRTFNLRRRTKQNCARSGSARLGCFLHILCTGVLRIHYRRYGTVQILAADEWVLTACGRPKRRKKGGFCVG